MSQNYMSGDSALPSHLFTSVPTESAQKQCLLKVKVSLYPADVQGLQQFLESNMRSKQYLTEKECLSSGDMENVKPLPEIIPKETRPTSVRETEPMNEVKERNAQQQKSYQIYAHKEEVLASLQKTHLLFIRGEPGSGKTTQVPQYILDNSRPGHLCRIIVIHPDDLAVVAKASRIAELRGEDLTHQASSTVGYATRFKKSLPHSSQSILFASPEAFLQMTKRNIQMTHLIIDGLSLGDSVVNLLLLYVKSLLHTLSLIRVVLLCDDVNTKELEEYFSTVVPPTIVNIQIALRHPISILDIEAFCGESSEYSIGSSYKVRNSRDDLLFFVGKALKRCITGTVLVILPNDLYVDYFLSCSWALDQSKGASENNIFHRFTAPGKLVVNPKVLCNFDETFLPESRGIRKIILATDIAVTTFTIQNLKHVIDCGLREISSFDSKTGLMLSSIGFASQNEMNQRMKACGKLPGGTYCLLVDKKVTSHPRGHTIPDVSKLCLLLAGCGNEQIVQSLGAAFGNNSPDSNVLKAFKELQNCRALVNNRLTHIGKIFSLLPMPPAIAQMIIEGAIFGIGDIMVTLAAIIVHPELFNSPACNFASSFQRANLPNARLDGSYSEHIKYFQVLHPFLVRNQNEMMTSVFSRLYVNSVMNSSSFEAIERTRNLFIDSLIQLGFKASLWELNSTPYDFESFKLAQGLLVEVFYKEVSIHYNETVQNLVTKEKNASVGIFGPTRHPAPPPMVPYIFVNNRLTIVEFASFFFFGNGFKIVPKLSQIQGYDCFLLNDSVDLYFQSNVLKHLGMLKSLFKDILMKVCANPEAINTLHTQKTVDSQVIRVVKTFVTGSSMFAEWKKF